MEVEALAFSYKTPPGGDVSLKSNDGVIFLAHSILLRLASSVFADMFSAATQNDVIELADDAESVSLMLRFIYPPVFMENLPMKLFEKSLRMAQKYDVSGIITAVDHLLCHSSNPGGLIHSDPVHAFCFATTYGLNKTHKAARESMHPDCFGFETPQQIEMLADTFPSASGVVRIVGAHFIRTRSLLRLLLGSGRDRIYPRITENDSKSDIMMCMSCFEETGYELGIGDTYEPLWFSCWCALALETIATQPFDKCQYLFEANALDIVNAHTDICQDCIDATRTAQDGSAFIIWRYRAMEAVKGVLNEAKRLYDL